MKRLLILIFVLALHSALQAQQHAHVYRDSIFMQLKGYSVKSKALDSINQVYAKEIQAEQIYAQEKYLALAKPYEAKNNETLAAQNKNEPTGCRKIMFVTRRI